MDDAYYDMVMNLVDEVIYDRALLFSSAVRVVNASGAPLPPNIVTFPTQRQYVPDLFRNLNDPYCKILLQLYDGMAAKISEIISVGDLWAEELKWLDGLHPCGGPCRMKGALTHELDDYSTEIYYALQLTIIHRGCLFQCILGLLESSDYADLKVPADRAIYTEEYRSVPEPVFQLFLDVCELQDRMIFEMFLLDFQYLEYMHWEEWGFQNEDRV